MNFFERSACKGREPQQIPADYLIRNGLLARMMCDRGKIRYILAPSLFGKTCLAAGYADTVFSYRNVYWINGCSPCFLRELDTDSLYGSLTAVAQSPGLAVFEDVVFLNESRAVVFRDTCARLLALGWEVLVSSLPQNDPLHAWKQECFVVDSSDLLFGPGDEQELASSLFPRLLVDLDLHRGYRIPGLSLRNDGDVERFLTRQLSDGMPIDNMVKMFTMLLVGSGELVDLGCFLAGLGLHPDGLAVCDVPYLGIDDVRKVYQTADFPIRETLRSFTPYFALMAEYTHFASSADFAVVLSDYLVSLNRIVTAARLLIAFADQEARQRWLVDHGTDLLGSGLTSVVVLMFESLGQTDDEIDGSVVCITAAAYSYMGMLTQAQMLLSALALRPGLRERERDGVYLLALLLCGIEPANQVRVIDAARLIDGPVDSVFELVSGMTESFMWNPSHCVSEVVLYSSKATIECAALAFSCLLCLLHFHADSAVTRAVLALRGNEIAAIAQRLCGDLVHSANRPFFLWLLGNQANALSLRVEMVEFLLPSEMEDEYQSASEEGDYQRHRLTTLLDSCNVHRAMPVQPHELSVGHPTALKPTIPSVDISVFGGVRVCVGGKTIDNENLHRSKVKALLALLVLHAGRDLSCDYAALLLWPENDLETARRNFYTLCSLLRQCFPKVDGRVVYFTREHGICRLEMRYVRTDRQELEKACHILLLDDLNKENARTRLDGLRAAYPGELLPGIDVAPCLRVARDEWRGRVVDTLLSAAQALHAEGAVDDALLYARQAMVWDSHREDTFNLLFKLQVAAGQRPAAIETWRDFRRYLVDELGLDPAEKLSRMYEDMFA